MKLTKTQWIIVAVVGVVAIYYFFLRNKGNTNKESSYTLFGGPRSCVGRICKSPGYSGTCGQGCSCGEVDNEGYAYCESGTKLKKGGSGLF